MCLFVIQQISIVFCHFLTFFVHFCSFLCNDVIPAYLEPVLRLTVWMDLGDGYRKPQTWPDGPYDGAIPSLLPRQMYWR